MAAINHCGKETKQAISINGVEDSRLPDTFNTFFSRFERTDFTQDLSRLRDSLTPCNGMVISQDQVTVLFRKTSKSKAPGPDGIGGRTLHHCAEQLSGIFT